MAFQLRRYQLRAGTFDEFLAVWRESVVPLRQKFGFEVVGAWGVPGTDDFVWIVYHPGDFVAAEQAYYQAPERAALDPDPASFIENAGTTMMTAVG